MSNRRVKHHTVRLYNWIHGRLQNETHIFESLYDAMKFLQSIEYQTAKIFSETGECVHLDKRQHIMDNPYA